MGRIELCRNLIVDYVFFYPIVKCGLIFIKNWRQVLFVVNFFDFFDFFIFF